MAKAYNFGIFAAFLFGALNSAQAESERCVPAADGSWLCGKDVTEDEAAPLPEPQSRSLPPVMLIDPARFGEGDIEPPPEAQVVGDEETPSPAKSNPVPVAVAAAAEQPTPPPPVVTHRPDVATPASSAESAPQSGKFSVQLAVASTPRGFDALLAKLGSAARNSQRRQLATGAWVLLIGNFNSIAAARNAVPRSVPGAFARDISTLNFK